MAGRCVIVGGAAIEDYDRLCACLKKDDFIIFCDSGLRHMGALKVIPDLIVGDFDSHKDPKLDVETIVLPVEKDDTDTVYAAKEGMRRGFEEFLLIGAVGARLDHTLANISILLMLDKAGKRAQLIDDYSVMEIVSGKPAFIEDTYPFFSLLNITGTARGVDIANAKYPLCNAEIDCDYQYGVSNQVLKGARAMVRVRKGCLLLIKIFRDRTE